MFGDFIPQIITWPCLPPLLAGDFADDVDDEAEPVQHPDAAAEDDHLDDDLQAALARRPVQAPRRPEGGVQ